MPQALPPSQFCTSSSRPSLDSLLGRTSPFELENSGGFAGGEAGKTYVFTGFDLIKKLTLCNKWPEFSVIEVFRGP